MRVALLLAIALASGDRPRLPSEFPVKIGPFKFGDTYGEVKSKCEKLGKKVRDGKPRFELWDNGGLICRSVWTGLPYLPGAPDLRFALEGGRVRTIGSKLDIEILADYVRQIRDQTGDGHHLTDGMVCADFTDGLGSICVDMSGSTMMFMASFVK